MRIRSLVLPLAALGLMSANFGCVAQEKYEALRITSDGWKNALDSSTSQLSAAQAESSAYKRQLDALSTNGDSQNALDLNRQQRIAQLEAENTDLKKRYDDAVGKIASGPTLSPTLTTELAQFADANPQLVSFDATTGMIRFKSDFTFASGDATLKPEAVPVLEKFAQILKSADASKYDILVAGHADNQQVSAGTRQRGHLDNWYLSAHRALSVAEALQKQGVAGNRIGAAGFGEMRPVADNNTKEGMAMNRRVEVIILPKPIMTAAPTMAMTSPPPQATPAQEQPTRHIETRPEMSK